MWNPWLQEYVLKSPGHKFVPHAKKRGKIYKLEKEMKEVRNKPEKRERKARETQAEKESCIILIMQLFNQLLWNSNLIFKNSNDKTGG